MNRILVLIVSDNINIVKQRWEDKISYKSEESFKPFKHRDTFLKQCWSDRKV